MGSLHRLVHGTSPSSSPDSGPTRSSSGHDMRGRKTVFTASIKRLLIETATANSYNRRLPLTEVAKQAGVKASDRSLGRIFRSLGYNRCVVRVKPFLNTLMKQKRLDWEQRFQDWAEVDWADVIPSDEAAFNCGQLSGTIWVTRKPSEEYNQDCLVPKFKKLTTVMAWGAICGSQKSELIIWEAEDWGKISSETHIQHIIHPVLFPWWQHLCLQANQSGYIYFQQDGAPAHLSRMTKNELQNLGIGPYIFPWPPSSPDMSPIEEVWKRMKRKITRRNPHPTTVPELRQVIVEEWNNLTPEVIQGYTSSFPERVGDLILAEGSHTKW